MLKIEEDLKFMKDESMEKLINQNIHNENIRNLALNQTRYKKLMSRDRTLICLYYGNKDDEELISFKQDIRDIIKEYRNNKLSYRVKTYSEESHEYFGSIDLDPEDNNYSRGTCFHVNEKVEKEKRTFFLTQKKGLIGPLENVKILIDNEKYDIFEYTSVSSKKNMIEIEEEY